MKSWKLTLTLLLLLCSLATARAQRIAVSTNLIEVATLTPNVEVELTLNHKQSFVMSFDANPFVLSDNVSFEHLAVSGEYRFWLDQVMYAHYIGAIVQLSSNNYSLGSTTFVGDYAALGVSYGYSFLISRKVNIVPNVAIGCAYDLNPSDGTRFKPMLLNFGVALQYLIK